MTKLKGMDYAVLDWQESYELIRDAIIQHLNPRDGDEAEEAIMVDAVARAGVEMARLRDALAHEHGVNQEDFTVRVHCEAGYCEICRVLAPSDRPRTTPQGDTEA